MLSRIGKLHSRGRAFSSIAPRVFQNSVFMAENFPAKLCVPLDTQGNHYEFTVHNTDKTADFETKVRESCPGISAFSLNNGGETATMGELKRDVFKMTVNARTYTVYPDLRSVSLEVKQRNPADTHQLNEENTSMSIVRQRILTDFYDHFVTEVGKQKKDAQLDKAQVQTILNNALAAYAKDKDAQKEQSQVVMDYVAKVRASLEQ
jgi:hypothetical protein